MVLKNRENLEEFEKKLLNLEKSSEKNKRKWKKTPEEIKISYLNFLKHLKQAHGSIFYSVYQQTKGYAPLVALSIAKAILFKGVINGITTIIIDGLNDKEKDIIRWQLKKLKIHYQQVRGMKDEQSVFLRLADSMAGFLRDAFEKQKYAIPLFSKFSKEGIIQET